MRHKTCATTQVSINLASQIDDAVKVLHVPDVLRGSRKDRVEPPGPGVLTSPSSSPVQASVS
jgi:hypothetical protein